MGIKYILRKMFYLSERTLKLNLYFKNGALCDTILCTGLIAFTYVDAVMKALKN